MSSTHRLGRAPNPDVGLHALLAAAPPDHQLMDVILRMVFTQAVKAAYLVSFLSVSCLMAKSAQDDGGSAEECRQVSPRRTNMDVGLG